MLANLTEPASVFLYSHFPQKASGTTARFEDRTMDSETLGLIGQGLGLMLAFLWLLEYWRQRRTIQRLLACKAQREELPVTSQGVKNNPSPFTALDNKCAPAA